MRQNALISLIYSWQGYVYMSELFNQLTSNSFSQVIPSYLRTLAECWDNVFDLRFYHKRKKSKVLRHNQPQNIKAVELGQYKIKLLASFQLPTCIVQQRKYYSYCSVSQVAITSVKYLTCYFLLIPLTQAHSPANILNNLI